MNSEDIIKRNNAAMDAEAVDKKDGFKWASKLYLTLDDVKALRMIKGSVAVSGKYKRGEDMTDANVIFAAGGLSLKSFEDIAQIDIDHFVKKDSVPQAWRDRHGDAAFDPFPAGFCVDSAAVKIKTGPQDELEAYSCNFIGSCQNEKVYDMIVDGRFKGCSAVDAARYGADCDKGSCNGDSAREGSRFTGFTLVLDKVPNSNGTWVGIVDEKDQGTIFDIPKTDAQKKIRDDLMANPSLLKNFSRHIKPMLADSKTDATQSSHIDTDGKWIDGAKGCAKFLVDDKGMAQDKADEIGKYIVDHPDEFNDTQITWLSGADLLAWWDTRAKDDTFTILDAVEANMKPNNLPANKDTVKKDDAKKDDTKKEDTAKTDDTKKDDTTKDGFSYANTIKNARDGVKRGCKQSRYGRENRPHGKTSRPRDELANGTRSFCQFKTIRLCRITTGGGRIYDQSRHGNTMRQWVPLV